MSRKHKKRNKPYTGEDAVPQQPVVHRYTAVVRSPLGEWWHEHKRQVKMIAWITGGGLVVAFIIYGLIDLVV
jgi:hypothetical protein